jgi:hypothetical protein
MTARSNKYLLEFFRDDKGETRLLMPVIDRATRLLLVGLVAFRVTNGVACRVLSTLCCAALFECERRGCRMAPKAAIRAVADQLHGGQGAQRSQVRMVPRYGIPGTIPEGAQERRPRASPVKHGTTGPHARQREH